ncbi:MAG: flavodoxin family protein [Coriobacteriia bacterium]|nr:flavodoxin family protein [Coriobacteriia bacterium]
MSAEPADAPRILCIVGSPRRGGNSDRLADALARGVGAEGGVAVPVAVPLAEIAPCKGCGACERTGMCAVHDGMEDIYPLLETACAVAVVSPVYFAGVPAQLKAFYDRCQPYWARRYVLRQERTGAKRPGALLLVAGGGDPFGAQCAVTSTKSVFGVLGVEMSHLAEFTEVDKPGDIEMHPGAIAQAESIGADLVRASNIARAQSTYEGLGRLG